MSGLFWLIRVAALAVALLFSVIELGLGAAYIAKINSFDNAFIDFTAPDFAKLAVAISVISLVVLTPLLVIDLIRKGAITSWVIVELPVISVMSILWLATAADSASATDGQSIDCSLAVGSTESMLCHTYQAIEAFGFLNWLVLMAYAIFLLVISIISATRSGNAVWQSTVRDHDFFARSSKPASVSMTQQAPQAVPAQQTQYPPQQYGTPPPQQYGTPPPQQGYAAQV